MSISKRESDKTYSPSRGRYKGRTFKSKHAYRNALARTKGYRNDYARRIAYRRVSSTEGLEALSNTSRQKRSDALRVVGLMRRDRLNLTEGVRQFNKSNPSSRISVATVKKYVKPALAKKGSRVGASPYDRLIRVMRLPTTKGIVEVEVKDSRTSSLLAKYENAVKTYLYTGDESHLRSFRGKYFRSNRLQYRFITDTDILDRLAEFGELEFESIYTQLEGK